MALDPALGSRLMDQERRYGSNQYHPMEVVCTRADGIYLWDVDGNRYLDFHGAHSAVNQGHTHTRIAAAMVEQCLRLALPSHAFRDDRRPPFLEKLCTLTGFDRALLMNSGSEAVETALKAARRWGTKHKGIEPGMTEILVFTGNSHGCTTTLISLSDDPVRTEGFGPFTPGFRRVAYGELTAVQEAVGPRTCAILVEPVQGGTGLRIPPRGFLKGLRELCDRQRILLLADEVQSGLGRTGRFFAFEHEGIRPDGVVLGKALSGGFYPVSAFLATQELMAVFTPGSHPSTFGGNPLACAVASAALDVLVDEKLVDRAAELGAYFQEQLRSLESPAIQSLRGLGLWAGLDLDPEAGGARRICEALKQQGLLCMASAEHTLRLMPPLILTREQLDWGLEQLRVVLG